MQAVRGLGLWRHWVFNVLLEPWLWWVKIGQPVVPGRIRKLNLTCNCEETQKREETNQVFQQLRQMPSGNLVVSNPVFKIPFSEVTARQCFLWDSPARVFCVWGWEPSGLLLNETLTKEGVKTWQPILVCSSRIRIFSCQLKMLWG